MRRRTIAIIVAVVLALAAAGLVVWYVSSLEKETTTVEQVQTVLVAKENIPARTTGEIIIEKQLTELQQVPLSAVVPGALTSEAALQGKVTTMPILKGQQILQSQLGVPEKQSLSFRIKQGMRAITLPIDRYNAVGGAIKEGDRVDVIATFEAEDFQQVQLALGAVLSPAEVARIEQLTGLDLTTTFSPLSRVILQQVEVLAVDPLVETETTGGGGVFSSGESTQRVPSNPVITLMVSPADAEKLVFAQEFGRVWFTLVPAEDTTEVETAGRSLLNLLR
ncbi:MAG: Flp pilus assembly protein CpaB [Thermoleophilia bacterium]|nr:Flp pilus assembly protein CpaB [Thermoleophilia bacterium]